jgi:hypothetical protein
MTSEDKKPKNNNVKIAMLIAVIPVALFVMTFFIKH